MNTAKIYHDSEGEERTIYQMVRCEPEWAASRIQAGEDAIEKLQRYREAFEILAYVGVFKDSENLKADIESGAFELEYEMVKTKSINEACAPQHLNTRQMPMQGGE